MSRQSPEGAALQSIDAAHQAITLAAAEAEAAVLAAVRKGDIEEVRLLLQGDESLAKGTQIGRIPLDDRIFCAL